jgi:hypothetical protein
MRENWQERSCFTLPESICEYHARGENFEAFEKIELAPNETKTIHLNWTKDLQFVNNDLKWVSEKEFSKFKLEINHNSFVEINGKS